MSRFLGIVMIVASLFFITKDLGVFDKPEAPPKVDFFSESVPAGDLDFPVAENRTVKYWVTNCTIPEQTLKKLDATLNQLKRDVIAETLVVCFPEGAKITDGSIYAGRLMRYMRLGQPDGDRRDNGLVFVAIGSELYRAVGFGLSKLVAPDLTKLKEAFAADYNQSLETALVNLVSGIDAMTRSKYQPAVTQNSDQSSEEQTIALIVALMPVIVQFYMYFLIVPGVVTLFSPALGLQIALFPIRILFELFIRGLLSGRITVSSSRSGSGGGRTNRVG